VLDILIEKFNIACLNQVRVRPRLIFLYVITFAVAISLFSVGQVFQPAMTLPTSNDAFFSVADYDKQKNCTTDLDKRPTSIEYLTHFNCGKVSQGENGQTIREFTLVIEENQNITISNAGHYFDAWTFNGTVPGPTMRMTEGDLVRINVINSKDSKHTHSMHMHSIHTAEMDGVATPLSSNSQGQLHDAASQDNNRNTTSVDDVYESGMILPGKSYTYEFVAQPYGVYPYHCHVNPVADHINRGLYGMMIIDPKEPREQMVEMVMTMNGYDMDYDLEGTVAPPSMAEIRGEEEREEEEERDNEIYTVNGKAFDYMDNPIPLNAGEKYRIYLLNMVEFDLVNSFHLHGDMISYIPGGTQYESSQVNDVIELGQANRGIMEFDYSNPGRYMFHAHVQEFTDLGWMGLFDVKSENATSAGTAKNL
jgi:FtsP/CotA-like multicopper oxidase with cupredoxin domain